MPNSHIRRAVSIAVATVLTLTAPAIARQPNVRLPAIMGDHMILQAGAPTPVFGWANPGETVTVEFAGQTKQTTADETGRWIMRLENLSATATGRPMIIRSGRTSGGDRPIELEDVVVGEVWLASGQSNMAMNVAKAAGGPKVLEDSVSRTVRVFHVRPAGVSPLEPLDDCDGAWETASPASVAGVTAVGYFFVRALQQELDVPVGLIHAAWGGTECNSWTSREALPAIRVFFDYADGLTTRDGKRLSGFQIAGASRNWVWADAKIDGQDVVVHSPQVTDPVAVRYAWADNPANANLTNASGLPASLLKTDDWPPPGDGLLVPVRTGPFVHVYRPQPDVFPGPSTPRLTAGKRYDDWTPNDHAITEGPDGRWHAIGITHPSVDSPPWHEGETLSFHAASPQELAGEPFAKHLRKHIWEDLPKVLPATERPDEPPQHHAPYIVRKDGVFWMFYGPNPLRYATSPDLMKWTPKGPLFEQEHGGRDPSIFWHNGCYVMLLTSQHSVLARESSDLLHWGESKTIFTMEGDHSCPESTSMVEMAGRFYLFYCPWDRRIDDAYQHRTYVVVSDDPFDFHGCSPVTEIEGHAPEIFHDDEGNWFISSVEWPHRGVSIAPLAWRRQPREAAK